MSLKEMIIKDAINLTLFQEMRRDPTIIVMGEDIVGGAGKGGDFLDAWGGPFGVTKGLVGEFGTMRVRDTPISEAGFIGAGVMASSVGLRPVVELMIVDFFGVAMDQIYNQAAKARYMLGGNIKVPLTIRVAFGGGVRGAAHHSQTLYSIFTHIPGLKIVVPSTPYDAKGLLATSIRDDNPVMFFEHKLMYDLNGPVEEDPYTIPLGVADIKREGSDVTVVALGRMVHLALDAAKKLEKDGISAEVLDPRTLVPFDEKAVLDSVTKTGRLLVVDEDTPRCSVATDIISLVAENALYTLEASPRKVTPPHTPVPYSPVLEDLYLPSEENVIKAIKEMMN